MNTPRSGLTTTLVVALALGASAGAAHAATRYVATTGSDTIGMTTNTCTVAASPCRHIAQAITQAGADDTISIGPGQFFEALTVNKPLTFIGAGSGTPDSFDENTQTFIDASTTPSNALLIGDDDVALQKLRIRGGFNTTSGGAVIATIQNNTDGSPVPNLTIDNCVIEQAAEPSGLPADAAVDAFGTLDTTIASSAITGYAVGINLGFGGSLDITDSAIGSPPSAAGAAIDTDSPTTITDSTASAANGIESELSPLTLTRTVVRAQNIYGIRIDNNGFSPAITLRDSVVAPLNGTLQDAIQLRDFLEPPSTLTLIGDTVESRSDTAMSRALDLTSATAGTVVHVHNTVLRAVDPGSAHVNADIATGAEAVTWDIGSSAYSTTSGAGVPAAGSATNISGDPQFVDPTGANLRLLATSPLLDKGASSILTAGETDVTGAPRSVDNDCDGLAGPDVGAYESQTPASCPAPVPPPAAPVVVAPVVSPPVTAGPPPARDTVAPTLTHLSFTNASFAVAASTHRHAVVHHGTKLRFTLSETATIKLAVQVAHHHSHKPTTYTSNGTMTLRGETKGAHSVAFSGKVGAHALAAGAYRFVVSATDAAGNVSTQHHLSFTIVHA